MLQAGCVELAGVGTCPAALAPGVLHNERLQPAGAMNKETVTLREGRGLACG
jgi:hypothetical protein